VARDRSKSVVHTVADSHAAAAAVDDDVVLDGESKDGGKTAAAAVVDVAVAEPVCHIPRHFYHRKEPLG
jgi:hypothetical protein